MIIPLRNPIFLSLISALVFSNLAWAETQTIFPVEEGFIEGGSKAEQVMDDGSLLVAAQKQWKSTMEHTQKIFLLFETLSDNDGVNDATLKLTSKRRVANESDARMPIELLLFGAPGGDWMGSTLTWANAPFHNPHSFSDEGTPELELLAQVSVDTSEIEQPEPVEFSDQRLAEFLRKNPGRVTLVVTSVAATKSPVFLAIMGTKETGRPERRPQLILELK